MLSLSTYWREVSLTLRSLFLVRRARIDPTAAAVVAHAVHGGVVDHGRVVNVVNVGHVHIVHRTVVEEPVVVPTSTFVAISEVAETIIDPAIETDSRAPIALMKQKSIATPTPIPRSPEEAGFRRQHPRAGYPVVISVIVIVGPVAGRPDITLGGAKRLFVHRQGRWADPDRYAHLGKRSRRDGGHYKCEQPTTNGGKTTHCVSSCPIILRFPGQLCWCGLRGLRSGFSGSNLLGPTCKDLNLSRRTNTIVCRKLLHVPYSAGSAAELGLGLSS